MDPAHVTRLKEEQERVLDETLTQIKKWEKYKDDYTALQERLQTLPDKISQNIMVPFGPVAFMPGQIVHTNEVMVLLGDNWFAERSAKQACAIVDRRKEHLQGMISDLAKQRHLLESRLGFTSELKDMSENKGDLVDIREEYDPEKEAMWREERKKKKKEPISRRSGPEGDGPPSSQKTPPDVHPSHQSKGLSHEQVQRQESTPNNRERTRKEDNETGRVGEGVVEERQGRLTEEELWARLDQLEQQEEELDELALMSEGESEESDDVAAKQHPDVEGKHVQWQDECKHDKSHTMESGALARPATIYFKHTTETDSQLKSSGEAVLTPTETSTAVTSPADIYKQYLSHSIPSTEGPDTEPGHPQKHPLKSILKAGSTIHPVGGGEDVEQMHRKETRNHVILPAPPSAFSGQVTERPELLAATGPSSRSEETSAPPKRVSRFKAARQQQR